MVRQIPKGAKKMKDFDYKLQAQNFKATMMESGFKVRMTKYKSLGLKNHPRYAVYYWEKPKR